MADGEWRMADSDSIENQQSESNIQGEHHRVRCRDEACAEYNEERTHAHRGAEKVVHRFVQLHGGLDDVGDVISDRLLPKFGGLGGKGSGMIIETEAHEFKEARADKQDAEGEQRHGEK